MKLCDIHTPPEYDFGDHLTECPICLGERNPEPAGPRPPAALPFPCPAEGFTVTFGACQQRAKINSQCNGCLKRIGRLPPRESERRNARMAYNKTDTDPVPGEWEWNDFQCPVHGWNTDWWFCKEDRAPRWAECKQCDYWKRFPPLPKGTPRTLDRDGNPIGTAKRRRTRGEIPAPPTDIIGEPLFTAAREQHREKITEAFALPENIVKATRTRGNGTPASRRTRNDEVTGTEPPQGVIRTRNDDPPKRTRMTVERIRDGEVIKRDTFEVEIIDEGTDAVLTVPNRTRNDDPPDGFGFV